jgi:hypothetical protein
MVILHLSPFEDAEVSSVIQRAFTDDDQPTIRIVPKDDQDEKKDDDFEDGLGKA